MRPSASATATRTLASSSSTNGASAAPARRSPMRPSASAMSLRCSGCWPRAPRAARGTACGPSPTSASTTALRRPTFSGSASAAASTSAASSRIAERRRARRRLLAHAPARIAHRLHEEVERLRHLVGVGGRGQARHRAATDLFLVAARARAAPRRATCSRARSPSRRDAAGESRASASAMKSRVRRTSAGTRRSNSRRPSSRSSRSRASSSASWPW